MLIGNIVTHIETYFFIDDVKSSVDKIIENIKGEKEVRILDYVVIVIIPRSHNESNTFWFLLKKYETKSDILYDYLFKSDAVGYDGKTLLFTPLSKFSHEFRCEVIDGKNKNNDYIEQTKIQKEIFDIIVD